jgi:hypothetical protein
MSVAVEADVGTCAPAAAFNIEAAASADSGIAADSLRGSDNDVAAVDADGTAAAAVIAAADGA